jgi:eukaryotic-like serine/threonine-protein kinase
MQSALLNHDRSDALFGTPYRSLGELGEGGMGRVIDAEHIGLGVRVAVKVLRPRFADDRAIVSRLRLEARAQASLAHPGIVRATDFGCTPSGEAYLVTERLVGRTLKDELVARGHLPLREGLGYALQSLGALREAHEAGIIHRDVKLTNLFLVEGSPRAIKLLDFGVAKVMAGAALLGREGPRTAEGMVVGTPRYAAPEQVCARPLDHRADLYALGICLYELIAGRDPFFEHTTGEALMIARVREEPRPPSALAAQPIPAAVDAFVLRAIARDRDERFEDAAAMAAALGELLLDLEAAPPRGRWPATVPLLALAPVAAPRAPAVDRTEPLPVPCVEPERRDGEATGTIWLGTLLAELRPVEQRIRGEGEPPAPYEVPAQPALRVVALAPSRRGAPARLAWIALLALCAGLAAALLVLCCGGVSEDGPALDARGLFRR